MDGTAPQFNDDTGKAAMAHPYFHALSSARQHGGTWEQYFELHTWFDQSKVQLADCRHRLVLHHALGIEFVVRKFTPVHGELTRTLAEQHVTEDFGRILTLEEALADIPRVEPDREQAVNATMQRNRFSQLSLDLVADILWACPTLLMTTFGPFLAENLLGVCIDSQPTRYIAEKLIQAAGGDLRPLSDVLQQTPKAAWMCKGARRLSEEFGDAAYRPGGIS